MNVRNHLFKSIIKENPVFVQMLALCPLLAVTTTAVYALTLGIATTLVMLCASTVYALIRNLIPNEVRIAISVVLVAGFVTIVQLLMEAYLPPAINDSLGIFIPLIVVNCIVISRLETFASKNPVRDSAVDALGAGIGFTLGLLTVGIVREFFGSGSIFGIVFLHEPTSHVLIMIMAPGAFFTLGALMMYFKHLQIKKTRSDAE
jgi:electron transport complex protein RnfE